MAVLLLGAAAVSGLVLGEAAEAVAIAVIVVVNALIALVQEGRAERAMAALERLEAPTATVVRDGRPRVVAASVLVVGDHVLVQAGDRVPADLVVTAGDGLEADESILTGESLPVAKRPGGTTATTTPVGDRDGCLHAGTLVTRGAGRGEVVATGIDTSLGAIAMRLRAVRDEPTPLQRQLGGLTRRLGLAAVVLAAAVFVLAVAVVGTLDPDEAFLTAVALAVAAVPEGLAAVTTVALALGVGRMAGRGAIVRRLPAVETLGAIDVLVIDKTGTVTENRMVATALVAPDGALRDVPTVAAVGPDGSLHDPAAVAAVAPMLGPALALCSDATVDPPTGDPTERALVALVAPDDVASWRDGAPRLAAAPFTSDRRRMSTVHRWDGRVVLLCKGAPEVVLPRCPRVWRDGAVAPMTGQGRSRLDRRVAAATADGQRVLAVAWRELPGVPSAVEPEEHDLVLAGLVVLHDPPRPSAPGSVAAVRGAGIGLVMATGDHPATAAAIARRVGIDGDRVLTGSDLRRDGLPDDPLRVPVLARVDPDQKFALVTRLQERGHVVAMTGDGVNDAPALRRADIGVALGGTGSDVAREAADVVVTDDDLATIATAIHEGRTIHDNLRKVVDYLVASNLSEVIVVVTALLAVPALGVPLFPLQLLWINLLTDGLPALALGVDPAHAGVMARAPRDPQDQLLAGGHLGMLAGRGLALAVGAVGALLVAHHAMRLDEAVVRTVLFCSLVVAQVAYAWVVRRPVDTSGRLRGNPWLATATVAALLAQLAVVSLPGLAGVFGTAPLPPQGWAAVVVGGLVGPAVIALARRVRWSRSSAVLPTRDRSRRGAHRGRG